MCGHHTHTDVLRARGAGVAGARCRWRGARSCSCPWPPARGPRRGADVCLCVLCIWNSSLSCVYVTHARLRYAGSNTSWTCARHMPHAHATACSSCIVVHVRVLLDDIGSAPRQRTAVAPRHTLCKSSSARRKWRNGTTSSGSSCPPLPSPRPCRRQAK